MSGKTNTKTTENICEEKFIFEHGFYMHVFVEKRDNGGYPILSLIS